MSGSSAAEPASHWCRVRACRWLQRGENWISDLGMGFGGGHWSSTFSSSIGAMSLRARFGDGPASYTDDGPPPAAAAAAAAEEVHDAMALFEPLANAGISKLEAPGWD